MKRIGRILLCILMITVLCGISVVGNSVVNSENKSKEKKRTTITKEEVKEWAAPDEESLEYYDLGEFSTTLPVVYMNTKGQQVLKENAIWGNIALLDGNGEEQSIFSVPNSIYRATIKYRGASSYSKLDKKQYRIKFYKNEKDSAKEVSLAGMGANSEWVLNGPYLDKTLIRNKLVYDLARELNGWAPDTRFVELFVDGKYQGVYLAVEPVTNGESRLRLAEFGLLSGETAYVVNRDRIDTGTEEIETWGKTKGYTYNALYIRYPSKNKITEKQKEYIKKVAQINKGKNLKYCILTMGCQLNENDSEKLCGMLENMGYSKTDKFEDSNFAIFNTCCVRENAEDKLFGNLGELKRVKENKNTIIAIGGCMMQEKHITDKIKKRRLPRQTKSGDHFKHDFRRPPGIDRENKSQSFLFPKCIYLI